MQTAKTEIDRLYDELMEVNEGTNDMTEEEIIAKASKIHNMLHDKLSKEEQLHNESSNARANPLMQPSKEVLEYLETNKSKQEDYPSYDGIVNIDPITGLRLISPNALQKNKREVDILELMDKDVNEVVSEHIVEENLGMYGDMTEDDVNKTLLFLKKFSKEDIEDESVKMYEYLPKIIQENIQATINENMEAIPLMDIPFLKEQLAREFYTTMNNNIAMDKEYIELEEEIAKLTDFSVMGLYLDNIFEVMETRMVDTANIIKEEEPEKAESLLNIRSAFIRAYTFERYYTKAENKTPKAIEKDMRKKVKSFDKICRKFNTFYKPSMYSITDCRVLLPILDKNLPDDIHIDDIKKFIIFMLESFMKLNPNELIDHTEMYYFIKIFECLEYIVPEDETDTKRELILNNVIMVINNMNSY